MCLLLGRRLRDNTNLGVANKFGMHIDEIGILQALKDEK
jgi:hypothetical protein